jgi:hypothetical protein
MLDQLEQDLQWLDLQPGGDAAFAKVAGTPVESPAVESHLDRR